MSSIWFSGTIAESIAEAKRRNALFIVFACDSSDKTEEMDTDVWGSQDLSNELSDAVAIRVEQSSTSFSQFTQFYPVMIVPSTYLICPNGTPLEIIAGACTKEVFIEKLKSTSEKFRIQQTQTSGAASTSSNADTLEEKKRYAQEKLDEIRQRKEVEAQAAEVEAEKRRKQQMAELSKAKQETEDRQMKQMLEEKRREKEEDRLAREAIKQKIAQDRADKAARFNKPQAEPINSASNPAKSEITPEVAAVPAAAPNFDGNVRIQVRFPDGTSQTFTSPAESTLSQVKLDIHEKFSDRIGNGDFNLAIPFPRRVFTEDELQETLETLQLIPSVVLVLLPKKGAQSRSPISPAASGNGHQSPNIFSKMLAIIVAFFSFLLSIFTGSNRQRVGDASDSQGVPQSRTATGSGAEGVRHRRNVGNVGQPPASRTERGNIHRLSTERGEDDENNTWNGNSTQQM